MFCTNCGKQINDGAAFCSECGAPIKTFVSNSTSNYNNTFNYNYINTTINHPIKKLEYKKNFDFIIYAVLSALSILLLFPESYFQQYSCFDFSGNFSEYNLQYDFRTLTENIKISGENTGNVIIGICILSAVVMLVFLFLGFFKQKNYSFVSVICNAVNLVLIGIGSLYGAYTYSDSYSSTFTDTYSRQTFKYFLPAFYIEMILLIALLALSILNLKGIHIFKTDKSEYINKRFAIITVLAFLTNFLVCMFVSLLYRSAVYFEFWDILEEILIVKDFEWRYYSFLEISVISSILGLLILFAVGTAFGLKKLQQQKILLLIAAVINFAFCFIFYFGSMFGLYTKVEIHFSFIAIIQLVQCFALIVPAVINLVNKSKESIMKWIFVAFAVLTVAALIIEVIQNYYYGVRPMLIILINALIAFAEIMLGLTICFPKKDVQKASD